MLRNGRRDHERFLVVFFWETNTLSLDVIKDSLLRCYFCDIWYGAFFLDIERYLSSRRWENTRILSGIGNVAQRTWHRLCSHGSTCSGSKRSVSQRIAAPKSRRPLLRKSPDKHGHRTTRSENVYTCRSSWRRYPNDLLLQWV